MSLAYLAFAVVVVVVAFVINRIQAGQVAGAQEAQDVAERNAKRFEDNLAFWQAQATNRNSQVQELQTTITGLRQSLQSKDNSLEDQVRQISERDLRLANQARALERAEHTIAQTYEVKLEQANERARKELQRANELDEQLGKEEKRYLALYGAVVKHRDAKGHERCWLNDKELYVAAGLDVQDPELPPLPEFISRCGEYWQGQSKTIAPVPRPFTQEKAEELIALLSQETLSDADVLRLSSLHCEATRFDDGRWILSSITYPGIVGVSEEGERELGGRLQEAYRKASDLAKFGPVLPLTEHVAHGQGQPQRDEKTLSAGMLSSPWVAGSRSKLFCPEPTTQAVLVLDKPAAERFIAILEKGPNNTSQEDASYLRDTWGLAWAVHLQQVGPDKDVMPSAEFESDPDFSVLMAKIQEIVRPMFDGAVETPPTVNSSPEI